MAALAPVLLSLGLSVAQINCDEWERTDTAVWRAEGEATVITEERDVYTFSGGVDATKWSEPTLWWALELNCRKEFYGGK